LALKGNDHTSEINRESVRLVFQVEDAEAERARLVELGVAVGPLRLMPRESYREIRLADPEGTPITLFSWVESPR
jgi:hypothetical protein